MEGRLTPFRRQKAMSHTVDGVLCQSRKPQWHSLTSFSLFIPSVSSYKNTISMRRYSHLLWVADHNPKSLANAYHHD